MASLQSQFTDEEMEGLENLKEIWSVIATKKHSWDSKPSSLTPKSEVFPYAPSSSMSLEFPIFTELPPLSSHQVLWQLRIGYIHRKPYLSYTNLDQGQLDLTIAPGSVSPCPIASPMPAATWILTSHRKVKVLALLGKGWQMSLSAVVERTLG